MKKYLILTSMLLAVLLSACGAVTPLPPSAVGTAAPSQVVTITPAVVMPTSLPTPEVLPSPVSGGGYPGGALQALADLALRLNVPLEQISVAGITPKDWPDSCLGLGRPDEACGQMITPGYLVILAAGSVQYEYHTDSAGNNIRMAPLQPVPAAGGEETRPILEWTGLNCEMYSVTPTAAFYGKCGETLTPVPGFKPGDETLTYWYTTFAPFEAQTPAGKIKFSGSGASIAAPADQRMLAEWARLQYEAAESGRTGAAWGLVFAYHREGGIAGFCDDVGIYLDGSVVVSTCKGLNTTLRLTTSELQRVYDWYDSFKTVDYSYSDPAVADKMTTKMSMEGQGTKTADETEIRAMLEFISTLDARAAFGTRAGAAGAAAQQALVDYFNALNRGDFSAAAKLYGGPTDLLQTWNPDIKDDLPAWLKRGCEQNGLMCLLPRSIRLRGPDARGGYQFMVEFNQKDGSLFGQGPCCGETSGPTNYSFQFSVIPQGSEWLVMDLPPYVP